MVFTLLYYIKYILFSGHKYGHGIHSPFVYDLITKVFNDKSRYQAYDKVEKIRSSLRKSDKEIQFTESGASSKRLSPKTRKTGAGLKRLRPVTRKIRDIVKYSAVNKKFGQLLFRLVNYFKPDTILELGTSLGISTMYMAGADNTARVVSIEADKTLTKIARQNFIDAGLQNIDVINNSFENALPGIIKGLEGKLFVFIDGNHEKASTLQYFNRLLVKSENTLIIVFDDINWSDDMREAWQEIKANPGVKITIDLFFMGIVFFNKGIQKQNFVIRY